MDRLAVMMVLEQGLQVDICFACRRFLAASPYRDWSRKTGFFTALGRLTLGAAGLPDLARDRHDPSRHALSFRGNGPEKVPKVTSPLLGNTALKVTVGSCVNDVEFI